MGFIHNSFFFILTSAYHVSEKLASDLHILGTPPAFILSQDQTLQKSR